MRVMYYKTWQDNEGYWFCQGHDPEFWTVGDSRSSAIKQYVDHLLRHGFM